MICYTYHIFVMKDEHEAFVKVERQEAHREQDKHKRKRLWRQEEKKTEIKSKFDQKKEDSMEKKH